MNPAPGKILWHGSTQLAPVPPVLVGCGDGVRFRWNLITVAWTGIICSTPPMLSISIRPERYSHAVLCECGEFTVNLPTQRLARIVDWCGVVSGRDLDKFAHAGLTALRGSKVNAPLVAEAPLSLECRVMKRLELGSHTLFLAEIVAVQAEASLLDADGKFHLEKAGLLAYAHGHYYALGREIGHFGFSVRKKPRPAAANRFRKKNAASRPSTGTKPEKQ